MKEINRYQLQQELKKELHNRNQETSKYFFYEDFITIEYDHQQDWIHADWRGPQTEKSVKDACEKLLEAIELCQCSKVLSDNTKVAGTSMPVAAWLNTNWLPRFQVAGIRQFAWVYTPGNITAISTDESIRNPPGLEILKTFSDIESAKNWLTNKVKK